jgi:serine protease Do
MKRSAILFLFVLTWFIIGIGFYFLNRNPSPTTDTPVVRVGSVSGDLSNRVDFVNAAQLVTPAVVHIKTRSSNGGGLGSGVIIAENGYIATNNHVIENAESITVILPDRREFVGELVGRDPNTDLALLKIKATKLPVVKLGNSDEVLVGEWVLAVGYPLTLSTTATAGIVSAKGRNIGIIETSQQQASQQGSSAIESFIQTDAAINPGNSGGALVNTRGELIGINAAIASMTGSYAGYAFAIPVNLARKILDDFKQFGEVRRGLLGVSFPSPTTEDQFLKQQGIKPGTVNGVFITDIQPGSAAAEAGLKAGDIIQKIDGQQIFSSSEFSERIARHRPGDEVKLSYLRDGKERNTSAKLKREDRSRDLASRQSVSEMYEKLGARFTPLPSALKQQLGVNAGVVVTEVARNGVFGQIGIPPGTIIVYINGTEISSPKDIETALLEAGRSRIQILAIAPDGSKVAFNFSFGA